jgi:hypothetical protein
MRIIYLAHPLGAATPEGVEANKARARRWVRWVYDNFEDVAVIADWLVTCDVLDDFNPAHRARGMAMNKAIIRALPGEFWMVGGRVSNGMGEESITAIETQLRIFDLTWLGEEPPDGVPDRVKALIA